MASSSSAGPDDRISSSNNPVSAVAQKAKSVAKRYAARPPIEQRPSIRIQPERPQQHANLVENSEQRSGGWQSWFRRRQDPEPTRRPVMVPRHVAENMAPHIAAAQASGNEDPQALAEHFAANADAYGEKPSGFKRLTGNAGNAFRSMFNHGQPPNEEYDFSTIHAQEYDTEMVDLLDVIDPEVSTLSTLTNVQNSLFVPSLGKVVNRRATYRLSNEPEDLDRLQRLKAKLKDKSADLKQRAKRNLNEFLGRPQKIRRPSISSQITEHHWAVLQHGETLDGWSREEKEMLDDMVRHSLHSRRAKFKRAMKGFGQYVRRPLGLFVTVYATLITLFGAAWVLFLIGWISLGSKKGYIVNVVDNVLVALFAIIGDGLAPFRAVDTYHMIYIAHYYRKTWKIRRKLGLPDLVDDNDLPENRKGDNYTEADIESIAGRRMSRTSTGTMEGEYSVLTEEQQIKLQHHERKFSKSHTFYKPHETATHYAFPLKLLVAIVLLLDCHSLLQISLGACTWGIPYKNRPFALTTVILCCSITCNILGGVLISIGDRRTRKTEVLELMMRRELTSEAIEKMQKMKMKKAEEDGTIDREERKRAEEEMKQEENEQIKNEWKKVPFLPKKLLGKGEDSREPALPRKHRQASKRKKEEQIEPVAAGPSTTSTPQNKPSLAARLGLGTKPEEVDRIDHAPAVTQSQPSTAVQGSTEGKRDKIMKMIRRADMDMS